METSTKIFAELLFILSRIFCYFYFLPLHSSIEKRFSIEFTRVRAENLPGFCALFSRSSSSRAARTADFASFPARVVVGSSKSILNNEMRFPLLHSWIIRHKHGWCFIAVDKHLCFYVGMEMGWERWKGEYLMQHQKLQRTFHYRNAEMILLRCRDFLFFSHSLISICLVCGVKPFEISFHPSWQSRYVTDGKREKYIWKTSCLCFMNWEKHWFPSSSLLLHHCIFFFLLVKYLKPHPELYITIIASTSDNPTRKLFLLQLKRFLLEVHNYRRFTTNSSVPLCIFLSTITIILYPSRERRKRDSQVLAAFVISSILQQTENKKKKERRRINFLLFSVVVHWSLKKHSQN